MSARSIRFEADMQTHKGRVREENEDSIAARDSESIWIVADGMGGHKHGKHASQRVVEAVETAEISDDFDKACEEVAAAIHQANEEIFRESEDNGDKMGSTVVALLTRGQKFAILWAGDSRAYLLRDHVLHQLTNDHTQVQDMIDRGLLTPEQAVDHPLSHVLARAVGVQDSLEVDAIADEILPGDIFLLCSDGLHGVLEGAKLAEIVEAAGPNSANLLIEATLAEGAPDNVSVGIISAFESTSLSMGGNGEQLT